MNSWHNMSKRLFHYNSGIYQIKNLVNGKFYIGQTVELSPRRYNHFRLLSVGKHHNPKLQASFNKHGISNFEFSVLIYCDINMLDYFEQVIINSLKPTYNIRKEAKSNRGHIVTEETKEKIRNSQLGKFISLETRQKISKSLMGRVMSQEQKDKQSKRMLGHKINTGRVHSQETKDKKKEFWKSYWSTHKRVVSDETKKKQSESRKKYLESQKEGQYE